MLIQGLPPHDTDLQIIERQLQEAHQTPEAALLQEGPLVLTKIEHIELVEAPGLHQDIIVLTEVMAITTELPGLLPITAEFLEEPVEL